MQTKYNPYRKILKKETKIQREREKKTTLINWVTQYTWSVLPTERQKLFDEFTEK